VLYVKGVCDAPQDLACGVAGATLRVPGVKAGQGYFVHYDTTGAANTADRATLEIRLE
jgi:hypothetical protein